MSEIRDNFLNFSMNNYVLSPNGTINYEISNNPKRTSNMNLKIINGPTNITSKSKSYNSTSKPRTMTYKSNKIQVTSCP